MGHLNKHHLSLRVFAAAAALLMIACGCGKDPSPDASSSAGGASVSDGSDIVGPAESSAPDGEASSDTSGGTQTNSAGKTTAGKTTPTKTAASTANGSRPYKDKKIDLGGRSVTFLMLGGSGTKYPDPDSDGYESILERIAYVEKTYNCKLKFDTTYGYPEINDYIVTNALSGLYVADVMYSLPWQTVDPYITQGIALPLDKWLDFSHPMLAKMKLNKWGEFGGKHYIFTVGQNGVNCGLLYNKDIFKRDDLEDPFELQQKGQWTWEKFLSIAERATKRDGSGKVTQWGVVTSSGADFLMQLLASNGAQPLALENDRFKVQFGEKKTMEVFEFLNKIVVQKKCGILTELVLDAPERGDRMWKQGKAAMAFASLSTAKLYSPKNCGFIVCPKGPSASGYATPAHCGPAYMVPSTAKDPEVSARILYDFFARWDTSIPGGYDKDEMDAFMTGSGQYEQAFCDDDFTTFKLYIDKQDTDVMNVVRFNEIQNFLINCIYAPNVYQNVPLSTSIKQWSAVAEDTIAEVNGKLAEALK